MEDTTSTTITADGQSIKNNELKNMDNIDDCQQQHQRRQRSGNGRWCTSSARSRSSTSFLIHNLLISCSGGANDVPTTTSPTSLPLVEHDNDNEDTSSSNESKSRSCSSPQEEQLSPLIMSSKEERDNVSGLYEDHFRIKRRKCTIPSRRRTPNKTDKNTNVSDDSDNEKRESKKILSVLKLFKISTLFIMAKSQEYMFRNLNQ